MSTSETAKNKIRNLLDLTFLEERTLAAPSVVSVAVSTVCDLHCPHCMRESLGVRENLFMDFDRLYARREELKKARRITLFGLGEPFLHPRFFDFIALMKSFGTWVTTSSHGMSLKPGVRERVIESGLDELTISMDGATLPSFTKLRAGADFETVVANIKALAALKIERKSEKPVLNVNMTVLRENLHEVPVMVRLAKEMGMSSVSFSSVVVYKPEDAHTSIVDSPDFERTMEAGRRLAGKLGLAFSFWRQKAFGWLPDAFDPLSAYGCIQLWSDQIIDRDGHVKLCCYIEEDSADAFEMGPAAAFNAERVLRERRALMEGRVRVECQGCMYLRERNPAWVQALLNQARAALADPDLDESGRAEISAEIERYQAKKDLLYPRHGHERAFAAAGAGGRDGDALPVY